MFDPRTWNLILRDTRRILKVLDFAYFFRSWGFLYSAPLLAESENAQRLLFVLRISVLFSFLFLSIVEVHVRPGACYRSPLNQDTLYMRIATAMIMVTTADHSADHFCVELQLQRARSVCHTRIIKRPATSNYARFVPTTISFSVYARDNRVSTPINVPRNSRARDKYWRKETQICRSDSRAPPDETRAVYMLFFFVFFSFFF